MKTKRRWLSLLSVLVLIISMFGSAVMVSAEGEEEPKVKLVTERNEEKILVKLVANEKLEDIGSMDAKLTYNADLVDYKFYSSGLMLGDYNPYENWFSIYNSDGFTVEKDGTILSIVFECKDGFKENTSYEFGLDIDFISNVDVQLDDLVGETKLTSTYKEGKTFTVTFYNNGTVYGTPVTVDEDATVTAPATNPTKGSYEFNHWSLTPGGEAYNFETAVKSDLKLYAVYDESSVETNKVVDLTKVKLTKKVATADVMLDETFTFKFEAIDAGHGKGPDIGNLTLTFKDTDSTKDAREKSVTLPEDVYSFNLGGVYKYKITETNTSKANWTYDDTVYYLYMTIEENSSNQLVLTNYFITTDENNADPLAKSELEFNNEYMPMTKLTVAKTVEGKPENATKEFTFTITFNDPSVSGTVKMGETVIDYGVPYEFKLQNDNEAVFTLPAGVTYTITEKGEEYYTGSVSVTEGAKAPTTTAGRYKTDLTATGEAVEIKQDENGDDIGENRVDFTNTYSITPPTGLTFNNEMIVILGLVLVAIAGGVVVNRKVKKARE